MCGIAAIFAYGQDAPPVRREEVEAITAQMFARGPDAGGTWFSADGRVGLGARRLAIVDLTPEGTQPMSDSEGELTIVFNGEIYNHRELRERLEARGARFHSHTDTEVILQMYRFYGESSVELLRGMFAFAIWDSRERRLFLARDPYGIKPLYYADGGGTLRVASSVKALLAGGALPRTLDPSGAAGFFLFGSVPEPFTICASIRAVEAGTTIRIDADGTREVQSFASIAEVFERARQQLAIGDLTTPEMFLRERASEAIAAHLVADVPIGIFLSAGIDSTTIMALSADAGHDPLTAVTVSFDAFRGRELDESEDAADAAKRFRSSHTTRHVTRDEFLSDMARIFDAMDQPTIDGVNTWFASKAMASAGIKVALSGIGGDELFGSYPTFREVPRIVAVTRAASRIRGGRNALRLALSVVERTRWGSPKVGAIPAHGDSLGYAYLIKRGIFMPSELNQVLPEDMAAAGLEGLALDASFRRALSPPPGTDFGDIATLEASFYLRNQLLRDTDWASMAHSVEVRTPLVDFQLFRQIAPLLVRYGARCKSFFATAPSSRPLVRRHKTGFVTPIAQWLGLPVDGTPTRARSWARRVFEEFAP